MDNSRSKWLALAGFFIFATGASFDASAQALAGVAAAGDFGIGDSATSGSAKGLIGSPKELLMNAFFFFNFLRVLFYVPAFKKMAESRSSLDSHSLFTWFCWIFANFTTGLVFYVDKGVMDSPVWLNLANAAMCCVGFGLIAWKRWRYSGVSESQATIDAVGDVEGDV